MIRNVEHLGIKFLCDLCEYIGRNQSELKKHKAKRHEGRFIFHLELYYLFDIFSVIYNIFLPFFGGLVDKISFGAFR